MKPFSLFTTAILATLFCGPWSLAQEKPKEEKTTKLVAFRSTEGRYVSSEGGGRLLASATKIAVGQTFTLFDLNGGQLADGDGIQLDWAPAGVRPTHWREGQRDGVAVIQRVGTKPDEFCTFHIKVKSNGDANAPQFLLLQTASGKWVSLSRKDKGLVVTEKEDEAEKFELLDVQKPE